jgi:hypothetical protein
MIHYIRCISSAGPENVPPSPTVLLNRQERMRINTALLGRSSKLKVLYRESIPLLPHMLDIGKHLAIISSIVVRHTRRHLPTRIGAASEQEFDHFCQKCFEVEEQALARVSKLASRRAPTADLSTPALLRSPTLLATTPSLHRRTSSPERRSLGYDVQRSIPLPDSVNIFYDQSYSEVSLQSSPATSNVHIPRVLSHESLRQASVKKVSNSSMVPSAVTDESFISRASRPFFGQHSRSASTDSVLSRKSHGHLSSPPPPPSACLSLSPDSSDEIMTAKRKGLLRNILRK